MRTTDYEHLSDSAGRLAPEDMMRKTTRLTHEQELERRTLSDVLETMGDVVREMHTKSGLLGQIEASTITLEDAGAETMAFLREHIPEERTVPLCGNSIGTDRRFLAVHLNEIEEYLHYRSVDVSSIKELVKRWNPPLLKGAPDKAQGHRALDDICESLDELRFYRDKVFRLPDDAQTDGN